MSAGVAVRIRRGPAAALLAATLTACAGDGPEWNATELPRDFPDLALGVTGESGEPLVRESLDGRVVLLAFGYTACPDVCPDTLGRLRAALGALPEPTAARVRVVFVSVDPRRDDPARLARYTAAFGERFIGATAPPPRLRELINRFGGSFSRGEDDGDGLYTVDHPAGVYAFDAGGDARLLIGRGQPVEAIAADIRRLVDAGAA